jgi:two-component system LytT family sensor kinase
MTAPVMPTTEFILGEVCVLVTAAFALTLVPGLRRLERSLLSLRDQATALLVFLCLGLVEEIAAFRAGWLNERIVAVCAAGLVSGPWIGLIVSVFVTLLASGLHGLPLGAIAISMLCGGLAGGFLYRWRPEVAQHPLTGFALTVVVAWLRNALTFLFTQEAAGSLQTFEKIGVTPVVQGLGTALILAIVAQTRDRDEQIRAAASAEVRALQARMNPHFLFNALNVLSALATLAPREVPRAAAKLRQFLRAAFDQSEQALVLLREEFAVVRAYLDIEVLRLGNRLKVEQAIDPNLDEVLMPPFSLQPLVENAVQHGLQSSPTASKLRLAARQVGNFLEISVSDDGLGVPAEKVEEVFFGERPKVHALALLRRRLQALFGCNFQLDVHSASGQGTTVTMRIPLRTQSRPAYKSLPEFATGHGRLVSR